MAPAQDEADLISDDSEDEDFCPVAEVGDKKKRGRTSHAGRGRGGGAMRPPGPQRKCAGDEVSEASEGDGGSAEEEPRTKVQEEEEEPTPSQAAKKARIDRIWTTLNGGSSTVSAGFGGRGGAPLGAASKLSSGDIGRDTTLASLCQPVGHSASVIDPDKHWMKGLGISSSVKDAPRGLKPLDTEAAQSALQAVKMAASMTAGRATGKVVVKEKANFAGKEIEVEKEVSVLEAQRQQAKRSGLDTLLASLKGDKKVSVLDKSRDDWRNFKKANVEVEEELEKHKRSDAQYLDKQAFLKKAELRQYEIERDQRLASDVRTRGRL